MQLVLAARVDIAREYGDRTHHLAHEVRDEEHQQRRQQQKRKEGAQRAVARDFVAQLGLLAHGDAVAARRRRDEHPVGNAPCDDGLDAIVQRGGSGSAAPAPASSRDSSWMMRFDSGSVLRAPLAIDGAGSGCLATSAATCRKVSSCNSLASLSAPMYVSVLAHSAKATIATDSQKASRSPMESFSLAWRPSIRHLGHS